MGGHYKHAPVTPGRAGSFLLIFPHPFEMSYGFPGRHKFGLGKLIMNQMGLIFFLMTFVKLLLA